MAELQLITRDEDVYRSSRIFYIIEAALEHFIALIMAGAYLARITTYMGLSDSVTGIISAFASLACSFQLIAILWAGKERKKKTVTIMHTLNQLFFSIVYLIPVFDIPKNAKIVLFITFLFAGRLINNIVQPLKINWFMSLIDDDKRGKFTANKEIISLIGGMIFTFIMGNIADALDASGRHEDSFIVLGFTVFVLAILHTYTLFASKEKTIPKKDIVPVGTMLRSLVKDPSFLKIVLVSVLWNIAHFVSTPFGGTYSIKELGLSMTLISIVSAISSVSRSLCSRPLGKYADKNTFAKMLNICFAIELVAFTVNIFTVPENGLLFYTIYHVLYAVGLAGINSGSINLIYERVPRDLRVCALAFKNTLAGLAGFLTTLAASTLVAKIQKNGNTFLGMNLYAQQVMSAFAAIGVVIVIIYLNTVVRKMNIKRDADL